MSLEDFFYSQPPVTHLTQKQWNETNAQGMAKFLLQPGRIVYGRLMGPSGNQSQAWMGTALPITNRYTFLTFDTQIGNGDYIRSSDGRLFRITDSKVIKYTAGTIPTHLNYSCEQVDQR